MRHTALRLALACLCLPALLAAADPDAKPFLHPLFTDHAVLQRDIALPVWGWTAPGQPVTVTLAGRTAQAVAGADGRWQATLEALPAGGPHVLTVTGPQSVAVQDVLLGDVWICSGQSNMEWPLAQSDQAEQEIAAATHPGIRLFQVPKLTVSQPREVVASAWTTCTPDQARGFSAVGYFFGRHLNQELKVPIGLINSSWGGTIAEAWVSAEGLAKHPDFAERVATFVANSKPSAKPTGTLDEQLAAWWQENDAGTSKGWAETAFDSAAWKTMKLPQNWEGAGLADFDGVVWLRRAFDLPEAWAGRALTLDLGPIDDRDTTFVNGVRVGGMDQWDKPRSYEIPAGVAKAGRNVLAVRVLDTGGGGGLFGKAEQMTLSAGPGVGKPLPLSGDWQYEVSAPLARTTPFPQDINGNPNVTTVLANGMIAPLVPFAIKGAIWYQGESNAGRAFQYRSLLPTLIADWRARFAVGDFPFLIVQLANFTPARNEPADSDWAELREAQALTAAMPGCGMAVAIDIGDANDIHPRNKQDVGRRLALSALHVAYGRQLVHSGPRFQGLEIAGKEARLTFTEVGGGLVAGPKGDEPALTGFAIAGEDRRFVWAEARVEGAVVVVSAASVAKPVAVRYAWAHNPVCNLFNREGLPASPFRTDRWPGVTDQNR